MRCCRLQMVMLLLLLVAVPDGTEAQKQKPARGPRSGVSNLIGTFSKSNHSPTGADSVAGAFYYIDSRKIFFEVRYPLHQIMVIEKNVTEIYYPEDEKAFRLESANPVILPLVSGLLTAIRPDNGLSLVGFTLSDQTVRNDTFVTHWTYTKSKQSVGAFELAQHKNRLVSSTFHAPDSVSYTKTTFDAYSPPQKGVSLPTDINTVICQKGEISTERVVLRDVQVNPMIPERIANFKIPKHVKIVKKKW